MNDPPVDGSVEIAVPPFSVQTDPALEAMRAELSVRKMAPELIVTNPAPSPSVPPESVTDPSSTMTPAAVTPGVAGVPLPLTM